MNKKSIPGFVIGFMFLLGSIVSSIIAMTVIVGAVYYSVNNPAGELPKIFQNWGGMIIGFYFGSFITLAKDYIDKHKAKFPEMER